MTPEDTQLLIVDDDLVGRLLLGRYFAAHYPVYAAEQGAEALDALARHHGITDIILDLNMPVMDGYSFLEALANSEWHGRVRVYIASCTDRQEFRQVTAARNINTSDVYGYFEKPYSMQALHQAITTKTSITQRM